MSIAHAPTQRSSKRRPPLTRALERQRRAWRIEAEQARLEAIEVMRSPWPCKAMAQQLLRVASDLERKARVPAGDGDFEPTGWSLDAEAAYRSWRAEWEGGS